MRWTLISFLCIVAISSAMGQKNVVKNKIEGPSPINVGLEEVKRRFTPPAEEILLKSGSTSKSNIIVTYVEFPEEAKSAFEYAVSIWEQYIESTVPISILAKWQNMSGNILAHSRPSVFYKNFDAAPVAEVYYPIALVEKLSGQEWNGAKEADLICSFSSSAEWYFGTDGNTFTSSYDFVTVVLHEIAHGLGISGFFADENGMGEINNAGNNPSIYDYYIYNAQNQRLTDNSIFSSPSVALHQQLTSDNLGFGCNNHDSHSSKSPVFAPKTWKSGMSIYHLENPQSNDHEELMSPYIYKGEANHNPGVNTIKVLSDIGWNANSFQIQKLNDVETTAVALNVQTKINSSMSLIDSTIHIIYSTDFFATKDSATLTYNDSTQLYESNLTVNNYKGKVYYYVKAKTTKNETYTVPTQAPDNMLSFKIGTDYYSPQLAHNPSKLIYGLKPEFNFKAVASDNIGIGTLKVEYKINGTVQEPFILDNENKDMYSGKLEIPFQLYSNDKVEYRIIAEDKSARKNKKILPAQGYYKVEIYETFEPATGYESDFNSQSNDFTNSDFEINIPAGFTSGILHTNHPYPTSGLEGDKYNLIAQLNHPIILEDNGLMTFDEIVLVEPGEIGTSFKDDLFWDYVIVEASKDNGVSWHPLVDGYDSGINEAWESRFTETLKSSASSAAGTESMFWKQNINLTDNEYFSEGDTVIFRFRLSSDNSINGWGWAIDNLKIQNVTTGIDDLIADSEVNVYPNPCTTNLFIDCVEMNNTSSVEINITDLYGKTVYRETRYDVQYDPKLKIDLSNISTGIYLANITDSDLNTFTQKIIKN